ncbi:MAG TPA: MFS transporter [Candidatus Aquilonibacter sp.]|nr:MFS transporter [Candidatus Aquilonibacter sp.]
MNGRLDAFRALALATLGALFVNLQPALAPAIARGFGLDTARLGFVLGLESALAILSSAAVVSIARVAGARALGVAAIALYIASNVATALSGNILELCIARGASGIAEGVMIALAFAALSKSPDAHRLFAAFGVTQFVTASAAFPLMTWLLHTVGWHAAFVVLAVVGCAVLLGGVPAISFSIGGRNDAPHDARIIGLLSIFVFFVAECAVWPFLANIGTRHGTSDELMGGALSIGALGGLTGSLFVAALSARRSGLVACMAAGALNVIAIFAFTQGSNASHFAVALFAFNFAWAAFAPLQLSVLKQLGMTPSTFALASTATNAGFAVGPILGGALLHVRGENSLIAAGMLGAPLAIALLAFARPMTPMARNATGPA